MSDPGALTGAPGHLLAGGEALDRCRMLRQALVCPTMVSTSHSLVNGVWASTETTVHVT